jgi:hypothetical protein
MVARMFNLKAARSIFLGALLIASAGSHPHAQSTPDGWNWSVSGNVFAGLNYQHRESDDISNVESQNWLMAASVREIGRGRVQLHTMFSLEPFTLKKIGSAQVFQTGETFNNAPLVDYQHPHDLFGALSAAYTRPAGAWIVTATAAAVGSPALGPPPFMHRPSAAENPQAPLSHHHLDSVHITPGVLTLGLFRTGIGIETSWFRGREPDETRTDIDFGALDSWSLRGSVARGPWTAELSGARINDPEPQRPGDMTRLMASVAHTRTGAISTAVTAAWGHNSESHGRSNAFLFESTISWLEKNHLFSRAELVGKELPHTHGSIQQPMHEVMNIGAFTLGYTRDVKASLLGRLGIGSDITMYYVPVMLQETYGAPLSFHVFVRYRFDTARAPAEHHH